MSEPLPGYRDLDDVEKSLIAAIKAEGDRTARMLEAASQHTGVDPRWLAIARTHFQTGYMALIRSIGKPTTFA